MAEISLLILFSLELQELFHRESGRAPVILAADLFNDEILLCLRIVFNGALHKAGILKIKRITVREIIRITPSVLQGIPGSIPGRGLLGIEVLGLEKG